MRKLLAEHRDTLADIISQVAANFLEDVAAKRVGKYTPKEAELIGKAFEQFLGPWQTERSEVGDLVGRILASIDAHIPYTGDVRINASAFGKLGWDPSDPKKPIVVPLHVANSERSMNILSSIDPDGPLCLVGERRPHGQSDIEDAELFDRKGNATAAAAEEHPGQMKLDEVPSPTTDTAPQTKEPLAPIELKFSNVDTPSLLDIIQQTQDNIGLVLKSGLNVSEAITKWTQRQRDEAANWAGNAVVAGAYARNGIYIAARPAPAHLAKLVEFMPGDFKPWFLDFDQQGMTPYCAGYEAGIRGYGVDMNPHAGDPASHIEWNRGHEDAVAQFDDAETRASLAVYRCGKKGCQLIGEFVAPSDDVVCPCESCKGSKCKKVRDFDRVDCHDVATIAIGDGMPDCLRAGLPDTPQAGEVAPEAANRTPDEGNVDSSAVNGAGDNLDAPPPPAEPKGKGKPKGPEAAKDAVRQIAETAKSKAKATPKPKSSIDAPEI